MRKYSAFTLIEMLIVMSIFIILLAIGIEAFSGLRTTILINQSVENFKQNVKWTQRAAILLKREPNENWIYGVGLDLTDFYSYPYEYRIFKWCSNRPEFLDDIKAQGKFPNFEEGTNLAISGNGSINTTEVDCVPPDGKGIKYIAQEDTEGGLKGIGAVNDFIIPEPLKVGYKPSNPEGNPHYVIYESVTGSVFYYDEAGNLKNYEILNPYDPTPNPERVLDFVVAAPDYNRGINIKINPVSGRVITESFDSTQVRSYTFLSP